MANAYRERVASLAADSRDWRVFPDPARKLSSTVEFLCLFYSGLLEVPPDAIEESASVQQQRRLETVALVGRLAELGLLTPLEHTWNDPETSLEKQFFVPQRHARVPKGWKELISLRMRDYSSVLFSPGAWPAFVWQEGCSMWSGDGSISRSTIPEVCRGGNFGPLACCVLASMLAQDPSLAKEVAGVGLQRLDRENFLQDCRALLRGETDRWDYGANSAAKS